MTIAASAIKKGIAKSHEPVDKVCSDCGEVYSVSYNRARFSVRCPACQTNHDHERQRERWMLEYQARGKDTNNHIGGRYKIIADPCKTWTRNGSLDRAEIVSLAKQGYLDTGMQWTDGKTVLTVCQSKVECQPCKSS